MRVSAYIGTYGRWSGGVLVPPEACGLFLKLASSSPSNESSVRSTFPIHTFFSATLPRPAASGRLCFLLCCQGNPVMPSTIATVLCISTTPNRCISTRISCETERLPTLFLFNFFHNAFFDATHASLPARPRWIIAIKHFPDAAWHQCPQQHAKNR